MVKAILFFILSLISYIWLFLTQDKVNIIFLSTIGCAALLVSLYNIIDYMEMK